MSERYDIVVIGGGHAGAEAAWAAARLGARTALVTMERAAIGRMSCNPAIGGIGKGQMVREIDALGGLMGRAADQAGIQFRMLNRRKGPAVWAPRCQADRDCYAQAVQALLSTAPIDIIEGAVEEIDADDYTDAATADHGQADHRRRVRGVTLADGRRLTADAVIVTTGTFLRALMHCGEQQTAGGRVGEGSAVGLSRNLADLGFRLARLKTGTPPRVHRDTLDYDTLEPQPGDATPVPFSFLNDRITQPQVDCWITYTNAASHDCIRAELHRAPMYSGQINSTGPRYCPSIEDKVVRFADKPRHQLFLEPEGYDNERIYCNGISTSLPADAQIALLATIPGLQRARILQYGYAVEYDFVPTDQTQRTLAAKHVFGLYFAGQINGTSGYEEAAGQGLVAGVNAALRFAGETEPFILGRDEAYIGVMIDDLITKPPTEPYRMFTSRAEYRLALRADNADRRLTPIGRRVGLVDDERWARYEAKRVGIGNLEQRLPDLRRDGKPIAEWMRRQEATLEEFACAVNGFAQLPQVVEQVFFDQRYAGYLAREQRQIDRFRKMESTPLPPRLDYGTMSRLRAEAREQLARITPATLGQASRISGITPADIMTLSIYLTTPRSA